MTLPEFCIKRPVFSTVLSLILITVGFMGLINLDTRFVPKFEKDNIMITTEYPGASSQLIETDITTPLEQAISSISGIDTIESNSYQGESQIEVTLKFGQPLYDITNQIRNVVAEAQGDLPTDAIAPVVRVGYGDMDLMDVAFTSSTLSLQQLRDYLDRYVTPKIEQVPGVAQVYVVGANPYSIMINLDPHKMAALGVSINQVQQAIQNGNIELPAGQIQGNSINFPITANTKLNTAAEFNNIIVANVNGDVIRVSDIGQAILGSSKNDLTYVKVNGEPGVFASIQNSTDANPLATADQIDTTLAELKTQMPSSIQVNKFYDQSVFMKNSVHEVYVSIFFAVLCVMGIIALFLGSWRTVLIPIVTIPICIAASFGVIYCFGFSINMITLLAIVLSIGLVVDDAIVMLENIYRHIEMGHSPFEAAKIGSKEIAFAVIAMTITLAAVYAPMGFFKNQASEFFQSFAFTLAGAVLISGFIALTLTPMMCSRLLKPVQLDNEKSYHNKLDKIFHFLQLRYSNGLKIILRFRYVVVGLTVAIIVGGYFLMSGLPVQFMPDEDIGFVIGSVTTTSGENIDTVEQNLQQVQRVLSSFPEVAITVSIADNSARGFSAVFANLVPYNQRKLSSQDLVIAATQKIQQIPGLNAGVFAPSMGGSMKHQMEFNLMGTGSYRDLYNASQVVISKLRQYPGLQNINSSLRFDSQQYTVQVNREVAGRLGVNVRDIDNTLAAFLGSSKVSTFDMGNQSYDVNLQAIDQDLHNINSINEFYVNNNAGKLIPLSSLVTAQAYLGQQDLPHFNRQRSVTIDAQVSPQYDFGQVVHYLQSALPQMLPADTKFAFTGRAERIIEANSNMGFLFLLAIVFIYLVLAAQFESFIDPFVILFSVPLSIVGALLSLKLVGGSLNIYTQIGLVTLIGLIAKHGILITQFANKLQEEGMLMQEALVKAAATRLRPILMTTAAMIFGALPLVFASGASADSRMQIGIVIIGGLFFGTFFSLVLVPITYTFAAKLKAKLNRSSS